MKLKLGSSYYLTLRRMVYMLISNVSTWTLKLSFFNRFFIFFSLFLLVYFAYSLFLIKIVLFRFKKLSFIIKILNLVGRSNIWVRCCLNQGYSRILVKSLSKRGSPPRDFVPVSACKIDQPLNSLNTLSQNRIFEYFLQMYFYIFLQL